MFGCFTLKFRYTISNTYTMHYFIISFFVGYIKRTQLKDGITTIFFCLTWKPFKSNLWSIQFTLILESGLQWCSVSIYILYMIRTHWFIRKAVVFSVLTILFSTHKLFFFVLHIIKRNRVLEASICCFICFLFYFW